MLFTTAGTCGEGTEFTGEPCEQDIDCSDGIYCTGASICLANECVNLPPVDCNDGIECTVDQCNDVTDRCESYAPDVDEHGVGDANCLDIYGDSLGADCNDNNPNQFQGNIEVCDDNNIDEDCDPETFGSSDADGDGLVSLGCCNQTADGLNCGNDCDDNLVAVIHGSQVCVSNSPEAVRVCQIDGTGVCAP